MIALKIFVSILSVIETKKRYYLDIVIQLLNSEQFYSLPPPLPDS